MHSVGHATCSVDVFITLEAVDNSAAKVVNTHKSACMWVSVGSMLLVVGNCG